jgi:hypothetical protein
MRKWNNGHSSTNELLESAGYIVARCMMPRLYTTDIVGFAQSNAACLHSVLAPGLKHNTTFQFISHFKADSNFSKGSDTILLLSR